MVEVGCSVFDDLDRHDLLGLEVLTLDHLPKRSLTEDIEDQVPVPARKAVSASSSPSNRASILVPSFFGAQNIVNIENVVAVLVIIAVILHPLARLGQDAARIPRRLVFEVWIADPVRRRKVRCERLERLLSQVSKKSMERA